MTGFTARDTASHFILAHSNHKIFHFEILFQNIVMAWKP